MTEDCKIWLKRNGNVELIRKREQHIRWIEIIHFYKLIGHEIIDLKFRKLSNDEYLVRINYTQRKNLFSSKKKPVNVDDEISFQLKEGKICYIYHSFSYNISDCNAEEINMDNEEYQERIKNYSVF